MEETPKDSVYHHHQQEEEKKHPFLVFISNLFASIKLPLPHKNKNGGPKIHQPSSINTNPPDVEIETNKPAGGVVTFPRHDFVPLKLEAEAEGADRSTNPLILWQVYAVGGIFILRWAWMRWNERKGQKKPDDEPPPAQD